MSFKDTLDSINRCFAKNVEKDLPTIDDFSSDLIAGFNNGNFELLESFSNKTKDVYLKSVSKRILAIKSIQKARSTDSELNIKKTWKWIYESLKVIPTTATISSIGSQGFLSIPLFKYDREMEGFDFIRLHIWDNSLDKYFDKKKSNTFSIHTHSFLAQSWVLVGKIVNNRFRVKENHENKNASLFTVEYNKTLNEINQHTSVAVNTEKNVNVKQISNEVYSPFSSYNIKHGYYHQSKSLGINGLSATFFSFTSKFGIADNSFVVGPMDIKESKINRKMHIDATYLIEQLNTIIEGYE
ncbi:hypothetical protein [Flagellimonas flava]|uniref:Uncharacterized protein n=1 Tax=Flagellimonas flava TaxID=570519 RepID=A0A1M5HKF7_9FLAO|nr:hypothetical protein [Allomuricauda flava]SHG16446.1 hypothetical protein SAMN04488116_0033 [Allomuricauda flava]